MGEYTSITDAEMLVTRGFEEISALGSFYLLITYLVTLELLGEKITNRILIMAAAINTAIIFSIKQIFATPRPEGGEEFITASFPSGHSATAFMAAGVLGWRYPKLRYWFLALATLVAISRVVIGAHFFIDILIGSAIGLTIGTLTAWKMEKMAKNGEIFRNLQ